MRDDLVALERERRDELAGDLDSVGRRRCPAPTPAPARPRARLRGRSPCRTPPLRGSRGSGTGPGRAGRPRRSPCGRARRPRRRGRGRGVPSSTRPPPIPVPIVRPTTSSAPRPRRTAVPRASATLPSLSMKTGSPSRSRMTSRKGEVGDREVDRNHRHPGGLVDQAGDSEPHRLDVRLGSRASLTPSAIVSTISPCPSPCTLRCDAVIDLELLVDDAREHLRAPEVDPDHLAHCGRHSRHYKSAPPHASLALRAPDAPREARIPSPPCPLGISQSSALPRPRPLRAAEAHRPAERATRTPAGRGADRSRRAPPGAPRIPESEADRLAASCRMGRGGRSRLDSAERRPLHDERADPVRQGAGAGKAVLDDGGNMLTSRTTSSCSAPTSGPGTRARARGHDHADAIRRRKGRAPLDPARHARGDPGDRGHEQNQRGLCDRRPR